jgi:hypothetical protein
MASGERGVGAVRLASSSVRAGMWSRRSSVRGAIRVIAAMQDLNGRFG